MTNDIKDRHVLAAAVKCKADTIVTSNLDDFPPESLEPLGIKALHPDRFLLDLFSDYGMDIGVEIIKKQAADLKNPPMTIREVIERLSSQVPDFAKCILYCEYSDRLSQIALKTLELVGDKKDKTLSYEGEEYCFEISNKTLTIKQKLRGEIFKGTEDTINCDFTLEDIEKLEAFEQQLDREFHESVTKN